MDITTTIKRGWLRWIGHAERMEDVDCGYCKKWIIGNLIKGCSAIDYADSDNKNLFLIEQYAFSYLWSSSRNRCIR